MKKPSESKTSSTSGTKPTAKNQLSSPDICSIISACAQSKCLELKFGDLYLRFSPNAEDPKEPESTPSTSDTAISDKHENQTARAVEKGADEMRDEQLAMMAIEDPVEFERMVRDGEFEDADDQPGDE